MFANRRVLPRADWTEELEGGLAALPLYQKVLDMEPAHPAALFAVGRITLDQESEQGVLQIEQSMALDTDYVLPGCELIYNFLVSQGRSEEATPYSDRANAHQEIIDLADRERSKLRPDDVYIPHDLDSKTIEDIKKQLSGHKEIATGYLFQKQVSYLPQHKLYLLAVIVRGTWYRLSEDKYRSRVVDRLSEVLELPDYTAVFALSGNRNLAKKITRISGSCIYRR